MTRKSFILFIGISIVVFFIGRTVYKVLNFSASLERERQEYTSHLAYNVSSRVDSVKFNDKNGGSGKIYCTITRGAINYAIEDSLAKTLIHHSTLRFNEATTSGALRFIMPGAERCEAGDSLVINSELNQLTFFRQGSQIYADQFSNLLEGRVTKGR